MIHFFDYFYLILSLLYVTLLPGFVLVEYLLPKLVFWKKIPLYLVFSIIISTYFSYITATFFGFNRPIILADILIFVVLASFKLRSVNFKKKDAVHFPAWVIAILVYITFFVPLSAGIFKLHDGYFVMSGPNWQDTAMHLSIIESISEGNFPPQAPYFSGEKLSYYYFSDLHSAIVNMMFGHFFPWIIVILNPYFAAVFFVVIYTLSFEITKNKIASIISGIGAIYYGNLGFVNLLKDVLLEKKDYFDLIKNNAYHLDFDMGLQMVPMSDYFLQNRPMMIGLPVVAAVLLLLYDSVGDKVNLKKIFIAGILNASLVKFQFFGLIIGLIFFAGYVLYDILFVRTKIKDFFVKSAIFLSPSLILILLSSFSKAGDRSVFDIVSDSFFWGPWKEGSLSWFLNFILSNFNTSIILFFIATTFIFIKLKLHAKIVFILVLPLLLIFVIPFTLNFTIYKNDMFKFFYYFVPYIYIVSTYYFFVVLHLNKSKKIFAISLFVLSIIFSSWTSINMLIHAFLNKTQGYSQSQYNVGTWIRDFTPQRSIFITSPTVHSPVSDIAGRLRILSYINWPYTHGFNVGKDNVFTRLDDIKTFYESASNPLVTTRILDLYNIQYIYVGEEERSDFPNAQNELESNNRVKKIYDQDNIQIFERVQ